MAVPQRCPAKSPNNHLKCSSFFLEFIHSKQFYLLSYDCRFDTRCMLRDSESEFCCSTSASATSRTIAGYSSQWNCKSGDTRVSCQFAITLTVALSRKRFISTKRPYKFATALPEVGHSSIVFAWSCRISTSVRFQPALNEFETQKRWIFD